MDYKLAENQPCSDGKRRSSIPVLTDVEIDRFWTHVIRGNKKQCWEWQSYCDDSGYGRFSLRQQLKCAHRVSYAFHNQYDPGNWDVCHKCDNPKCVNPNHLFLGTGRTNYEDMDKKGRHIWSHKRVDLNDPKVQEIIKSTELSRMEKAEMLGVTKTQITRYRKRLELPSGHTQRVRRGRKFPVEIEQQIISKLKSGMTQQACANEYVTNKSYIGMLVKKYKELGQY